MKGLDVLYREVKQLNSGVKKNDGGLHVCIDYRMTNNDIKPGKYIQSQELMKYYTAAVGKCNIKYRIAGKFGELTCFEHLAKESLAN